MKILIVEDEPFIALDIEAAVEAADHQIVGIADSHATALELARRSSCDAALIDIRLRDGFTGPDIATALRAEFGIPFAFITGNMEQLPPDGLGAAAIVEKPFTPAQIAGVLTTLAALSETP